MDEETVGNVFAVVWVTLMVIAGVGAILQEHGYKKEGEVLQYPLMALYGLGLLAFPFIAIFGIIALIIAW